MSAPPATTTAPGTGLPSTYVPSAPGDAPAPVAPGATIPSPPINVAPPSTNPAPTAPVNPMNTGNPALRSSREPLQLPVIQGVPPIAPAPGLSAPPAVKREATDKTASRPVHQATYFQLIQSPPATIPVHYAGASQSGSLDVEVLDASGWQQGK